MRFAGSLQNQGSLDMARPKSILLVKLSAIGDVVHTLPLLEVLRNSLPDTRIDWLVEEEAAGLIEGHPAIDRILVSRRKAWQRGFLRGAGTVWREVVGFLHALRKEKYDLVIDMQGLLKSGLLTGLSRGKRKMGFTWAREGSTLFLTDKPYPVDEHHQHAIDRYLKAAEILGCSTDSWQGRIPIRESDRAGAEGILHEAGLDGARLVAINPMARWETKLWEPEKWTSLGKRIEQEFSCRVLFTGGAGDRDAVDRITGRMNGRPVHLAGRLRLKELAYLYSRADLVVSTDTGPMHIAAAMGRPVVALFGPTAPWRTGPYGKGHRVVRAELECSPCFKRRCRDVRCMKEITVEMVLDAAKEILAAQPPPPRPLLDMSAAGLENQAKLEKEDTHGDQ